MKTRNESNSTMALAALAVAASLAWTATASASPVTVLNPGFEANVLADGNTVLTQNLSNWTGGSTFSPTYSTWSDFAGDSGATNPDGAGNYAGTVPGGNNAGFAVTYPGFRQGLRQILAETVVADAIYDLSVKVGNPDVSNAGGAGPGYVINLVVNGSIVATASGASPATGTFVTVPLSYVAPAAGDPAVGQPIEIRLLVADDGSTGARVDFDDVTLARTNNNPAANGGGPYTVAFVGSLSLNGSASLPSDGQTLTTYEWDLTNPPDGIYDVSGATPAAITYADLKNTYGMAVGANTIRLRVTDDSSPTPKTSITTATVNLGVGPPANDAFANAIDLTGVGAGQTGNVTTGNQTGTYSIAASLETGEPVPEAGQPTSNNSVWFKWTSPGDGAFTFYTNGSTNSGGTEWDSIIGIYTGAAVNALTPVPGPGNNPQDTGVPETKTVTVTPGTTYYIQLTGFRGEAAANILLNWNYVATVYQADMLTYGPGGVIGPVVANAANIAWTVPFGSNLATLAPSFTLSLGATCTLDGNPAVSGATVDFSGGPKNYVVTSQGATIINTYTVTVTIGPAPTDGTWTADLAGNWSDTTKWSGGIIANGIGATANFNTDFTAARTVTLDSARSIGHITKTDTTPSDHVVTISGTPVLTLDTSSGSPVITNSDAGGARRFEIGCPIASADGLSKGGAGFVRLTSNTSIWTGATTVSAGLLDLGGIPNANIGGGSGRNITVTSGAALKFNVLSNAFLSRLVETTDEIVVMTGSTGNSFDFSSSTGATLPNAFISCYATNGAKCELSGAITPANGAYRLGSSLQGGALGITQTNPLTGSNALIVNGNRVVVVGAHTFTGDTTIRDGGVLGLSAFTGGTNSLGLQNSILDTGAPSSTGKVFLEAGSTAGPITGTNLSSPTSLARGTISATFGGLKGSRNLISAFLFTGPGNNTSATVAMNITGFTLNPGTAVSCTYSGSIADFTPGVSLVMAKSGDGTQEFSGSNSYTGTTTISGGTLKISHANGLAFGGKVRTSNGATSVSSGATLDLNGTTGINEPIVLNGIGVGSNGALVNNSVSPAGVSNGIAALTVPATGTGSAYTTTVPTVTISGGGGTGATATALLGLTTASITTVSGGAGWAIGDTMFINNASGTGAVAQVTTVSSGAVTGLSIIQAGAGFTAATSMVVTRIQSAATTNPTVTCNATNFTVGALQLTNAGSGYTSVPTVTFSAGSASDAGVTKTLSSVVLASASNIGGSGNTTIAGVVSETGGSQGLTKTGAGTLTLTGANTYTGATSVNVGTLALVGGSQKSAITVASLASLGFTLGSPTVSTSSVDLTTGTVKITGTVDNVSDYKLMTASTVTGTPALDSPITGYALQKQAGNTELWLVHSVANPYAAWSGGPIASVDTNGDGVTNGVAWALGAADPNVNAISLLPTLDNTSDATYVIFNFNRSDAAAADTNTAIKVEYNTDLGASWTPAVDDGNNVLISVTGSGPTHAVQVKLKRSTLAAGGKLFARMNVVVTTP